MGILWARSGSVEFDNSAVRAPGAKAYFYEGNTTTPLTVYQNAAESSPHTAPVEADSNGRWPTVFIPYIASYDVKITTSGGTQLSYPTEIPNPDPVEAAADVTTADQIFLTGDLKFRHATGTLSGYVRCNGRTIGDASSGATERANADCSDLFTYLWNGFANTILAVSGGRGGSAAADFAAHKTIALFDMRMGIPIGVDDMGNSAASRGSAINFFSGNSTTGGSQLGGDTVGTAQTLSTANLPTITPAGTISQITPAGSVSSPSITISGGTVGGTATLGSMGSNGGAATMPIAPATIAAALASAPTFTGTPTTPTFTGTPFGSGSAHNIVQYGISGTWYIKL